MRHLKRERELLVLKTQKRTVIISNYTHINHLEFPSSHLYVTQMSASRTEMKCTTAARHTQIIAIMDINVPYFHDFKINSEGSKLLGFAVTSPYTVYLEHLYPLSYPFLTLFPHFFPCHTLHPPVAF